MDWKAWIVTSVVYGLSLLLVFVLAYVAGYVRGRSAPKEVAKPRYLGQRRPRKSWGRRLAALPRGWGGGR